MNILIAGLGAIGSIYATKLRDKGFNIKVLVDRGRIDRYQRDGIVFNGIKYCFEYVLPEDGFEADVIMICVKATALEEVLRNIKNFVTAKTVIISLINGISSEGEIKKAYPDTEVPYAYYIGHSGMRSGNVIEHDGVGKIVFEFNETVKRLFDDAGIDYDIPKDILSSLWQKFIINIGINQTTAILRQPYSCFRDERARKMAEELMQEGVEIARRMNIKGCENFIGNAFKLADNMPLSCKTSMFQDIESGRETEVEIFSGEVIRLGRKYGVETPKNLLAYKRIKGTKNNID